jgi:hypothetical protein
MKNPTWTDDDRIKAVELFADALRRVNPSSTDSPRKLAVRLVAEEMGRSEASVRGVLVGMDAYRDDFMADPLSEMSAVNSDLSNAVEEAADLQWGSASRWTPAQQRELEKIADLASLEMMQAYELCSQCDDKFVIAKTYHYVYKKGRDREIPDKIRRVAKSPNIDASVWTPEFTEEVIRISKQGIQDKMDYVKRDFAVRFRDDIDGYGFRGCAGSAALFIGVLFMALL